MNIQAEKLELIRLILETDNLSIINSIKSYFTKEISNDFWLTLPMDEKEAILQGLDDIKKGKYVEYEEFIKQYS